MDRLAEVWQALVLGTHDYVTKNGFSEVVIGLSGGVDSSIVAALAVDALGADNVHGVLMPSRYSSDHSLERRPDAGENLGIDHRVDPDRGRPISPSPTCSPTRSPSTSPT